MTVNFPGLPNCCPTMRELGRCTCLPDATERPTMTTPPKTREEWYDKLLHLSPEYSEDVPRAWAETLNSIMSLQAEVVTTRNENTELLRSLCSANNQIEQLQAAQDEAKDALQAEVERLREDAKWCRCIVARGYENEKCRNCGLFAKNPFEKARQPK